MSLRNYVNDLEFSKKVNRSDIGRKFENGDFARSVELSIHTARDAWNLNEEFQYDGCHKYIDRAIALPISILTFSIVYPLTKFKNYKPASYREFSNNPDLILNH